MTHSTHPFFLGLGLLGLAAIPNSLAADDSASGTMVDEVETAIVEQTNDFRKENDLQPLAVDDDLTEAASKFARYMAETDKYGHNADGKTPAQRAQAAGYEYCVVRENIAYRTNTGEVTADSLTEIFVQGWIDSPSHRENMAADYVTETGVGVATTDDVTYFAVQLFGRPESAAYRIEISNRSGETQTIVVTANDSRDEFDLPPRGIVRMRRCFPSTIGLPGNDQEFSLTESANLVIDDDGLSRK